VELARQGSAANILLAISSTNSGDALLGLRRYADAAARYDEALAIYVKRGTDADVYTLGGLGMALLGEGKPRDALPSLERALVVADKSNDPSAESMSGRARAELALAQALRATAGPTPRISDLARAAASDFRRAGDEDQAVAAEAWAARR
jgi:tetratricopeptide (TPR) repeat protein